MINTDIKLIFRNWKRNKLFSLTAMISLIIGFACCNILTAFVINEWKISNGSPDNDRIFALKTDNPMTLETTKEKTSYILKQIPQLFKERYPEVESFCRFSILRGETILESDNFITDKTLFLQADKNVNEYFTLPVVAGNLQKTLSSPGEVAITKSLAKRAFGSTDILGQTFSFGQDNVKSIQKVTTVIDDSYTSSFVAFDILMPFNEETYRGGVTFLKLKDSGAIAGLLQKVNDNLEELPRFTNDCKYYLQTLQEFYFDKSETQTSWQFLLKRDSLFITIGLLAALTILLVACFNFINLYLVRLFKSNNSNSIQKLLGASSWQLQKQILLESFITTFIAFSVSLVLVFVALPSFNKLFGAHLSLSFLMDKSVLGIYTILIGILTFIPTIYLGAKFKKRGKNSLLTSGSNSSKAVFSYTMISIQFGFSVMLIIAAVLYVRQLNFISETANINPNIIELKGNGISDSEFKTFKEQLNNLGCVDASTLSNTTFLNAWIVLGEDKVPTLGYNMDNDFLKVHNIKLVEGMSFDVGGKYASNQSIVNETFVDKYKIQAPIGQNIEMSGGDIINIVGVVKDFYTEPFSSRVKPTVIKPFKPVGDGFKTIQIKLLRDAQLQLALSNIEEIWSSHFPDKTFNYSFPADDFKALHNDYRKLSEMIMLFTIISFLLTGFGLFGIAWYSVEQRTKEIGIRKVNGAKIFEVLILLNKDFVKWVAIAFVIACPIAYYAMSKWLENFAYKTELSWWIFALAGISALSIALITVSWQSWKAATRNPVEALRYE